MAEISEPELQLRQITAQTTFLKKYFMNMMKKENWYPGIDDVECYLANDPTSLYVGELNGNAIGTLALFKYEGKYSHFGCYVIDEAYRNRGYGSKLTEEAFKQSPSVGTLSLYAVRNMATKYERTFGCQQRWNAERHIVSISKAQAVLRDACCSSAVGHDIKRLNEVDFQALCNYDSAVFGYKRDRFLKRWLQSSFVRVAVDEKENIIGCAAVRMLYDQDGYKVGPVYCGSIEIAKHLLKEIFQEITENDQRADIGTLDIPVGANADACELSKFLNGKVLIECVFMSSKNRPLPKSDFKNCFCITGLEIG